MGLTLVFWRDEVGKKCLPGFHTHPCIRSWRHDDIVIQGQWFVLLGIEGHNNIVAYITSLTVSVSVASVMRT